MKKLTTRIDLVYKIYYPIFLISIALVLFFSRWLSHLFYLNIFFILPLFILAFRHKNPLPGEKLPLLIWLGKIIGLEFLTFTVFLSHYFLITQYVNVATPDYMPSINNTLHQLFSWGLFPWPITIFLACRYALNSYTKNTTTYFIDLFSPAIESTANQPAGLVINAFARQATVFWLSFMLIFTVLLAYYLFAMFTHVPIVRGPNFAVVISLFALLCIPRVSFISQKIRSLFRRKIPLIITLLFLLLIVSIFLISATTFFYTFSEAHRHYPSHFYQWIQKANWAIYWQLFIGGWWLFSSIPISLWIAKISRGYSIKAIITATSLLPLLIFITTSKISITDWHFLLNPLSTPIVFLLCQILLLGIFLNWRSLSQYAFAYLDKQGIAKQRKPLDWLKKLSLLALAILYLYLPGGMVPCSFFISAALTIPLMCLCLFAAVTTILIG